MTKRMYVSSAVQAHLLSTVLIPQMKDGFWKNHRPADHALQWADVEIVVTEDGKLGADGWKVPRNYNFVNPEFIKPNEHLLVAAAQSIKASSNFRSVKKELIELSWIVGGRLADRTAERVKANRGTNKTPVVSAVVEQARTAVKKAVDGVKRTAVKKVVDPDVQTIKTSSGATVTIRRAAVTKAGA